MTPNGEQAQAVTENQIVDTHTPQALSSAEGRDIARQILDRYADAPGVIAMTHGLAGASHRRLYNPVPLLTDLQQRWAQHTVDGIQTWPELPLAVPLAMTEASTPAPGLLQSQVELSDASAMPVVKPVSYLEQPLPPNSPVQSVTQMSASEREAPAATVQRLIPADSHFMSGASLATTDEPDDLRWAESKANAGKTPSGSSPLVDTYPLQGSASDVALIQHQTDVGAPISGSMPNIALVQSQIDVGSPISGSVSDVALVQRQTRVGPPISVDADLALQRLPIMDVTSEQSLLSTQATIDKALPVSLPLGRDTPLQPIVQTKDTTPVDNLPIEQGQRSRRLRVGAPFAADVQLQRQTVPVVDESGSPERTSVLPLVEQRPVSESKGVTGEAHQPEAMTPPEVVRQPGLRPSLIQQSASAVPQVQAQPAKSSAASTSAVLVATTKPIGEMGVVHTQVMRKADAVPSVSPWSETHSTQSKEVARQPMAELPTAPRTIAGYRPETFAAPVVGNQLLVQPVPPSFLSLATESSGTDQYRTAVPMEPLPGVQRAWQMGDDGSILASASLAQQAPSVRQAMTLANTLQKMPANPVQRQAVTSVDNSGENPISPVGNTESSGTGPTASPDEDALIEKVLRKLRHSLAIDGERRGRQPWI